VRLTGRHSTVIGIGLDDAHSITRLGRSFRSWICSRAEAEQILATLSVVAPLLNRPRAGIELQRVQLDVRWYSSMAVSLMNPAESRVANRTRWCHIPHVELRGISKLISSIAIAAGS